MTEKQTEALEKLNRGIQVSRQEVQQRTMSLAQDYFDDSASALKQQIEENRAALEGLPDQVPGGREEAFQTMFQELMDNYSAMEKCINEARQNVANLDTDQIRRQGEVEATDAARRDARDLGIDLTEVEGTGTDGRVTVDDVKKVAETMEDGAAGEAARQAQDAAGQAAGQATDQAGQVAGQATDQAGQVAGQAQEAAGGAARQAQDAAGQAASQARDAAGQATDQAQQAVGQAQDALGQATGQASQIADQGGGGAEEVDASDAARREAEAKGIDLTKVEGTGANGRIVYWDVADLPPQKEDANLAGQAAQGASDAASQATGQAANQAGEVASQVAGQADGAVGQTGGAANQLAERAVSTARQTADQAGQTAGQGAGSVAEQAGQSGGTQESDDEEPRVTKAAKRKAEEMGVDLSQIQGSGAGGLITIRDVVGA